MRNAILTGLALLAVLPAACPARAQLPPAPAIGQLEIKAYQKIPKSKIAVQLTADTALGRHLRGKVMERLARRGNEVGFSGGNVMRMDVGYFDLSLGGSSGGAPAANTPSYDSPGDNPRQVLPSNNLGALRGIDSLSTPSRAPTLRLTLTLYSIDTGKVIWVASSSCSTIGGRAPQTGEAMINTIFDNADANLVGDAGCPI